jgi:hypothetical protein
MAFLLRLEPPAAIVAAPQCSCNPHVCMFFCWGALLDLHLIRYRVSVAHYRQTPVSARMLDMLHASTYVRRFAALCPLPIELLVFKLLVTLADLPESILSLNDDGKPL